MIVAEFLALLGLLGAGALGASAVVAWVKRMNADADKEIEHAERMHDDLRKALQSHDYRQLDDWLVLYGDKVSPDLKKHVDNRRDELYIEKNP